MLHGVPQTTLDVDVALDPDPVVSRGDQIRLLRAAGRPQDREDANELESLGQE